MSNELIVAFLAFAGTLVGTLGGIVASGKLTGYRIEQLEKRVAEHNHFARRLPVLEEKWEVVSHRISDLEKRNGTSEK